MPAGPRKLAWITAIVTLAMAGLFSLLWAKTSLGDTFSLDNTVEWVESVSGKWWTPWTLILLHVPAGIVMFPRQILTIAGVVGYGPWLGFAIAMAGVQLASVAAYWAGLRMPRESVERFAGTEYLARMTKLCRRRGLAAMTLLRLLPIAPFVAGSVMAGALRVKLRDLVLGTFAGMAPGMAVTTIVGDQIAAGMAPGRHFNGWVLSGALAALVVLAIASKIGYNRIAAA